jgi:NAD(P)-dependent dehydrogenase (short-subunit alcohol dehydrogenase family)
MNTKDLFSLKGRVALVTGGSRGIGKMIAEGFIAQGAKVYISARKADACNQTAQELSKGGGTCISIPMNISTLAGAKSLAAAVMAQEPKLDILVNNAGAA